MKKFSITVVTYVVMLLLTGILVLQMGRTTNQAMASFVIETSFVSEYCLGDSEWKPLEENIRLSAFDGDLVLRGQFLDRLPMYVSFYLDHIGIDISVNGELVFDAGRITDTLAETDCGSYWTGWLCTATGEEDEVEIRLHNPHSYGNANAYQEFLDSLCYGYGDALERHIKQESRLETLAGIFILVVSMALLGMAVGYLMQKLPAGSLLWSMAVMSLCMGGYILLDAKNSQYISSVIAVNTCIRQCCIMFAALELTECIRKTLTDQNRKYAGYLVAALCVGCEGLIVLSFLGITDIYDTGGYWAIQQGIVSLVLFCLCISEWRKNTKKDRILLFSYMLLLIVLTGELVNARMNFWQVGIAIKFLFVLLFVLHLVRAARSVAVNHQASIKVTKLESKLRDSQLALAFSQIKPHFLYNTLSSIGVLCRRDPDMASEATDELAKYLRVNLDSIDRTSPVSFQEELNHVRTYLWLERMRFGDDLQVSFDIKAEHFLLPALSVQPIVENAIRHGMMGREGVCNICIRSEEKETYCEIVVEDDGVGFDMTQKQEDGKNHVGITNVRNRLEQMVNGTLTMESEPGKGTRVTIRIPREEIK